MKHTLTVIALILAFGTSACSALVSVDRSKIHDTQFDIPDASSADAAGAAGGKAGAGGAGGKTSEEDAGAQEDAG